MKRLFQLGTVFDDPALDRRVVDVDPTFLHEFFDMAIAQGIRHIPAHAHQNDILREMGPLEAHRHRRSPSLFTLSHREGDHTPNASNENLRQNRLYHTLPPGSTCLSSLPCAPPWSLERGE